VVTRLVARGLVKRVRSGDDHRSVSLSLSPRGERLARRTPDVPQERLVRGIEQLSAARRRALASALGELARAVDAAEPAPAMFFEDRRRRSAAGRSRA
jgi:DNA-binding MarR family transcriptional regulator